MTTYATRINRLENLRQRTTSPNLEPPRRCSVMGCTRLTQRSLGSGLSDVHCKAHVEFRRRHGSVWRRSYSASEIAPYRKAAECWLKKHRGDPHVVRVVRALEGRLQAAGRVSGASQLRWMLPAEKARVALARFREGGHTAEELLGITLTIKATQAARGPRADREFRDVQIAKLIHRRASGTHATPSGFPLLGGPKYPRAEGHFMRILGHQVEDLAGLVADADAVEEVLRMVEEAGC